MVLELQSFTSPEQAEEEEEKIPSPQITVVEADERYGRFNIEPLEKGYGMTLGNALRRILLSSMPGCAIVEAVFAIWPVGRLRVADRGLREGILRRLMAGSGDPNAKAQGPRDSAAHPP